MINVIGYLKGIPPSNKNPEKPRSLSDFIAGVNAFGDNGILSDSNEIADADVAVIQGFIHEDGKSAPHLEFRRKIVEHQKRKNKRTIIIDSNLFLYRDLNNSKGYLRYSYDGIFPNTGEYCYDSPDPARWVKIKKDLNTDLKPWRTTGNHILICLQRNAGWSMRGKNVVDFFQETVMQLKNYTDRPIIVRCHPGDRKAPLYSNRLHGVNVTLSEGRHLLEDLNNAWATIVYNSSPSVASVIEGVPSFVMDPEHSQSAEVSSTDLSLIENPYMPDRLHWIQKLSQCHWNNEDLISGNAWKHMRNWYKI